MAIQTNIHKDYLLKDIEELQNKIINQLKKHALQTNSYYMSGETREIFAIIKRIKEYIREG